MIDKSKLKELLLGEIEKRHKLGEQVGGSGHLGYVSFTNLEIGEPAEIEYNGEKTFEIPFTFETYTESEFHYATDNNDSDDMYRNIHHAKIIVNEELKVLNYTNQA